MGVMDFLKGLFSSNNEDQNASNINISESGLQEPTPEEPKVEEGSDNVVGSDDLGSQE